MGSASYEQRIRRLRADEVAIQHDDLQSGKGMKEVVKLHATLLRVQNAPGLPLSTPYAPHITGGHTTVEGVYAVERSEMAYTPVLD